MHINTEKTKRLTIIDEKGIMQWGSEDRKSGRVLLLVKHGKLCEWECRD